MIVGAATVTVGPDASGFGTKTEAAIKAALAGVQAKIELTLDEANLRAKISAVVAAAGAGQNIKIGTNVDTSPISKKVAKAISEASSIADGQLNLFDMDTEGFKRKVEAAMATVDDIEIGAAFDDEGLRRDVNRATRAASQDVKIGVSGGGGGDADRVGAAAGGIFGRAVLRSAGRVLAAGGLAQLFTAATAGATAIGGALISATGAAGSLLATSASLPAMFSAAAQAAASIGFALSGVGGALKAFGAMQKAVGKEAAGGSGGGESSARSAERAVRDATRGIAEAERSMADAVEAATERVGDALSDFEDAQRDAADVAEVAARRVADAEENLADAHRRTQSAQEDLTQARRDAVEEISALRDSVESLSLAEEDAALRVAEAEARLREGRQGTSAHPVLGEDVTKVNLADRERAARDALNLRRAQLSLVEATKRRAEAQERLNEAEAAGVDGNEKVIDATERLEAARRREADAVEENSRVQRDAARSIVEANERVTESWEEVGRSQRDLARAQTDGAERVALAQERLADAVEDAASRAAGGVSAVTGATSAYEAALARLSPASRQFVEFLVSLEPLLRRVQATAATGLLPGVETAIRTVLPLVDDFEPIIGDTAKALANLAIEGANLIASPGFRGDLVTIGRRNIDIITGLGRAAISGASSLRHITIAAGPLTQHLVGLTQHYALLIEQTLGASRANGTLEAFFGRVSGRIDRLLVTLGFLGTGLFRVFRDATPSGDRYFDLLTRLAAKFDILTERASKSGALRKFFDDLEPAVKSIGGLIGDIATGLFRVGNTNLGSFTAFIDQLRNELLPVLLEVLGTIDTDFLGALVSLATGFASLFGAVLGGNPTLTFLVEVLGDMASGISTLLTDIPILSPLLQGLVTILGGLAVVGAVAALKDFASTAFGVQKALEKITGAADAAELAGTRVGKAYEAAGRIIGRAFLIAGVIFAAKAAVDAFAPSVDKATAAVLRSRDPLAEFERQVNKLKTGGSPLEQVATNVKNMFEKGIIGAAKDANKAIASTDEAFRALAVASAAQAQTVINGLRDQGKATESYQRILDEVISDKARQGVAEEEVSRKVADATRALQTNNDTLKEHADRMRAATDQALSLSGAEISTEAAIDALTDSVIKNGLTFDTNTEKGRENKRMLDDVVGSIQNEITELGKAAAAGSINNERMEKLREHLRFLAQSEYPGTATQAQKLLSQLDAIQPIYNAKVELDTREAEERIAKMNAALRALGPGAGTQGEVSNEFQNREFGGRVMRNAAYIVGEKRPELFIPDENGVILPSVPPLAYKSPMATTTGANFIPEDLEFDMEGLERALRDLEDSLTDQLGGGGFTARPEAESDRSEPPATTTAEFDYDAMASALNRLGSRTVTINTEVTSAMPAEVGIDTARNLRNAIYLEIGD